MKLSPGVWVYPHGELAPQVPAGALALAQIASPAFGDGSHPTTRLCAGAVDVLARHARSVLDVGTGTGILARIALARGTPYVCATDIDPIALAAAATNTQGTAIIVADRAPDSWGARFDLVVANILEGPLRMLAPALVGALAPGGILLLSGFTPAQSPALRVAFAQLSQLSESLLEGWSLLSFKAPPHATSRP